MDNIITGSILLGMSSAYLGEALGTSIWTNRYLFKEMDHQIGVNNAQEDLIKQQTALLVQQTDKINEMAGNTNAKKIQGNFKTVPDEKTVQPKFNKKGGNSK